MHDLILAKPKRNFLKLIIYITLIALLVIVLFSVLGIYTAKKYHKYQISKDIVENIKPYPHEAKVITTYKFTAEGKKNMSTIYKSESKRVFLTFDDGPSKNVTPLILDLLKKEKIPATFFVLGNRVDLNPDLVKREYEEGHYIANHGYTHKYSNIYTSVQSVLDEYNKTESSIKRAIGNKEYSSHLFRFPGGSIGGKYANLKKEAKEVLDKNNIAYVDWNCLTGDAEGKKTKEDILAYFKSTMGDKKSVVILMHDASNKMLTYESLPDMIKYLREQGYRFKNFYDIIK